MWRTRRACRAATPRDAWEMRKPRRMLGSASTSLSTFGQLGLGLVVVVVRSNIWYDDYHPGGTMIDVFAVVSVLIVHLRSPVTLTTLHAPSASRSAAFITSTGGSWPVHNWNPITP